MEEVLLGITMLNSQIEFFTLEKFTQYVNLDVGYIEHNGNRKEAEYTENVLKAHFAEFIHKTDLNDKIEFYKKLIEKKKRDITISLGYNSDFSFDPKEPTSPNSFVDENFEDEVNFSTNDDEGENSSSDEDDKKNNQQSYEMETNDSNSNFSFGSKPIWATNEEYWAFQKLNDVKINHSCLTGFDNYSLMVFSNRYKAKLILSRIKNYTQRKP